MKENAARLVRLLMRLFEVTGMIAVGLMVLHVTADVAMRGLLNQPIQGTLEMMAYWYMVAISFVGLWLAQVNFEHISVTMITERLDPASRRVLDVAIALITVVFLVSLGWFSAVHAIDAFEEQEFVGAYHIAVWPMRFVVVVGLFAYAVTVAHQTVTRKRRVDDMELEELASGI